MPYTPLVTFTAGNTLPAADLNSNFANLDYLNSKINQEIQIMAGSMTPKATNGAVPGEYVSTSNGLTYNILDFADGGALQAQFVLVMPSDYNGDTLTARFLWTANSTSTNSVAWGIQGGCVTDDNALDFVLGTVQYAIDANKSAAYDLNITSQTSAITLSGTPAAGKMAFFSVWRVGDAPSDTLAATARLIAVVLTYTRS